MLIPLFFFSSYFSFIFFFTLRLVLWFNFKGYVSRLVFNLFSFFDYVFLDLVVEFNF